MTDRSNFNSNNHLRPMRRILPVLCLLVLSQPLIAQPTSHGFLVEQVGEAMIAFANTLSGIAESATSVEDIEKAQPKIEAVVDRVLSLGTEIAGRIGDTALVSDVEVVVHDLEMVMRDSAVAASLDRLRVTMQRLKKERPEFAKRLDEIGAIYQSKITAGSQQLQDAISNRRKKDAMNKLEHLGR